jgi:hypothetical protein
LLAGAAPDVGDRCHSRSAAGRMASRHDVTLRIRVALWLELLGAPPPGGSLYYGALPLAVCYAIDHA